jgi:histidinol-phosphate/aromatic aminotransferase/cobyric acid decarboxylase-like protein
VCRAVPGAGSSELIFLAFREWLRPKSRVFLFDPTYGEYAHVAESLMGCQMHRQGLLRRRRQVSDSSCDLHSSRVILNETESDATTG